MDLPEILVQEIEILRAIYGEEPVRLVQRKKAEDEESGRTPLYQRIGVATIEATRGNTSYLNALVLRPEDASELMQALNLPFDWSSLLDESTKPSSQQMVEVWVTLQLIVPAGYPSNATPTILVEKSRGIGDVATEAMMDAAEKARQQYGLQEEGCLAPLLSEVKDALGKAVSECYICMMDCDPGSAIFVACNCVFHRECLEEWRGLKDQEKISKADAATESIKSQRDALERLCAEADEQVEEAEKQVAFAQLQVDRAAVGVEQAMKKAQATAEDDEEQIPSEEEANDQDAASIRQCREAEESESSVELDTVDYRNEARWGAPEVSLGGLYHNKHTKKNWHPSVRMNRKRPKKYLKRIDEKLEEMKKEGKRQLSEEMSQAVTKWEKAQFEHKEAKLVLEKDQENLKKLKEKAEKLQGELDPGFEVSDCSNDLRTLSQMGAVWQEVEEFAEGTRKHRREEWTNNYLGEERAKFTSLPLLCPVCQNEVDAKVEEKVPAPVESEEPENAENSAPLSDPRQALNFAEEVARQALLGEEEKKRQKAAADLAALEEKMVFMSLGDSRIAWQVLEENMVHLDDELLTTIELLMEAYSEKTVDGQELLEPFTELLEVLRESEEKTDQEIKARVSVPALLFLQETTVEVSKKEKVPYFKTKLDLRPVVDHTVFQEAASQQGPFQRLKKFRELGIYQPQLFISDFWLLEKDYLELNETWENRKLNLTLSYSPTSLFAWSIQARREGKGDPVWRATL
eukprot:g26860.t1